MSKKQCKQRYFDKTYANADFVLCACGCGNTLKNRDHYGRKQEYINGHNGRKYDDPSQYKREWNHRNRPSRMKYKDMYAKRRKAAAIKQRGGRCEDCGLIYDGTNGCVFQFHHSSPKEKQFPLTLSGFIRYSKERILFELNKYVLLCANCHFKRHSAKF